MNKISNIFFSKKDILGKLLPALFVIFITMFFSYGLGKERVEEKYRLYFEGFSYVATITECEEGGGGCYINTPDTSLWVPCKDEYTCTMKAMTEEQRIKNLESRRILEELLESLPSPIEN